jgi:septal ring factor EnvC (AmiA/AmiB activator)
MSEQDQDLKNTPQEQPPIPPINTKNQMASTILTTAVKNGWINTSNLFIQVLFVLPAVVTSFMGQSDLEDKNKQLEQHNQKLTLIVEELQKQNTSITKKSKELSRQIGTSLNNVEASLNVIASEGKKLQYRIKMIENYNKIEYPDHIKEMIESDFNMKIGNSPPHPASFKSLPSIVEDTNIMLDVSRDEINVPLPNVNFDEEE